MIDVECGTEWIVDNSAADLFSTSLSGGTLTVMAEQNYVTEEKTATIILLTSYRRIQFATITVTQNAYNAPEITVETNEWHAPAVGALTTEIGVTSSLGEWTVENECEWLNVENSDSGVTVTATQNDDTAERVAQFVIKAFDGYKSDAETIRVTQDARAYVSADKEVVALYEAGESAEVIIESNYDWDYSFDSSNDWFSISREGDVLIVSITADNDTESDRNAVVTLTAGDGEENVTEGQFTVTEYGPQPDALIFVYTIASVDTKVTLPLSGTVECTVIWGDGSGAETVTSIQPSHTFSSEGEYRVRVIGTVTGLSSEGISKGSSPVTTLTAIEQWGDTGLTSLYDAFYYYTALVSLPADTTGAFSNVETFAWAFSYCTALKSIPEGLFAYCSMVTTYADVFYKSGIEAIPEGLFDNSSAATTFDNAFYSCESVTSIPESLFAKCTNAESFYGTFQSCTGLTSVPAGLFANNSKATSFRATFYKATGITEYPEELFANCVNADSFQSVFAYSAATTLPAKIFEKNTKATNFYGVFYQWTNLTEVPEGIFANAVNATNFDYLFYGCTSLKSVPSDLFANCPNVTEFTYAFYNCSSLESVPAGLFSSFSKVTTFAQLFRGCSSLNGLPETLFSTCSEVSTFTYAFYGCTGLTSLPEGLFSGNKDVKIFSYAFSGCTGLTGETPYDTIEVDGEQVKIHLYERADHTEVYTKPTTTSSCFKNCLNLTDYDDIPSGWR